MSASKLPIVFQAFLSHRYKSPETNLFFFRIFDEVAEVQFEVDEGLSATSVTRLERMVRGSDAFIGIYPYEGPRERVPSREELLHASRYFRLEHSLAVRARKPSIIFFDKRYRAMFKSPPYIKCIEFDSQEVLGAGGFPMENFYRQAVESFCESVAAWKVYQMHRGWIGLARTDVVMVLPPEGHVAAGYSSRHIDVVRSVLESRGYTDIVRLTWPPRFDSETLASLEGADWVVTDIGASTVGGALISYLHGSFIPTLRLAHLPAGSGKESLAIEPLVYGGFEVGYPKDIVRWREVGQLEDGLRRRLELIQAEPERISTWQQAEEYFEGASLRKEAVFISYSSRDEETASELRAALKKRFQTVFDYRDGSSIRPGFPWLEEIFNQLSVSGLGIPVLSKSYLASGNCMHEAREMIARRDSGKMRVIPIKLSRERLALPSFLEDGQYLRVWEHGGIREVVEAMVRVMGPASN